MVVFVGMLVLGAAPMWAEELPNIVLIFTDDLGYGDVGAYGATKVRTPRIDRLAREGRRFTDAHTASAVCTPSRYALLTGEYPFRGLAHTGPVMSRAGLVVDPNKTTLADVLRRAGYATAIIGKWHLGFGDGTPDWNGELKPGPLELGFDYFFGIPVVNSHPPFVLVENHRVLGLDPDDPLVYGGTPHTRPYPEKMTVAGNNTMSGGKAAHALYVDDTLGTQLTEKAIDWMRDHAGGPFFLLFSTPHIHHPFTPHPRFEGTSDAGRYGDFIHELDWMVGRVLDALTELGVAENTLVVFTSDNGGMLNIGGQEAWRLGHRMNAHLLGFKFDAWEGGHRVPLIVRWPGKVPPGTRSDHLIGMTDLFATFAEIAGQPLGADDARDSLSALAAWAGEPDEPAREELLVAARQPAHLMLRQGDWAYINRQGGGGFGSPKPGTHLFGGPAALDWAGQQHSDLDGPRFKPDAPNRQLYNLRRDPSQTTNIVLEHPEMADRMEARLQAILRSERTAPVVSLP